ncbi:NPCBM/NEW2 domain-containing protein [Lentzea sp. NPDC003310]|uniref:NPCBM/NEW2 domain-containing protein n=1 Tax=Lentzea sp. NPDC003310 TaxID=3154447 RepID=UPI0033A04CAB
MTSGGAGHKPGKWIVAAALAIVLVVGVSLVVGGALNPDEAPATVLTTSAVEAAPPPSSEDWYDLTTYAPVEAGTGLEFVPSVSIGVGREPLSGGLRGTAGSSAAQPVNFGTWQTASRCTRLSVWVGKDAASSQRDGVGQFVIKADETEAATRQAGIDDAPQHVEVDISDVDRLTLLDVRAGRDAVNAWGTPRVFCAAPPGRTR